MMMTMEVEVTQIEFQVHRGRVVCFDIVFESDIK